jgi:hypothetical protein
VTTQTKTNFRYAATGAAGVITLAAFVFLGVISGIGGLILLATTVWAGRVRLAYTVVGVVVGVIVLVAGFGSVSYETTSASGSNAVSTHG